MDAGQRPFDLHEYARQYGADRARRTRREGFITQGLTLLKLMGMAAVIVLFAVAVGLYTLNPGPDTHTKKHLVVPLPHPPNRTAHSIVLDEIHPLATSTVQTLLLAQAKVHDSINLTSQELMRCFARTTTEYACSSGTYMSSVLDDEIDVAREQLRSTAGNVSDLVSLYESVRQIYHNLNSTAAEAAEKAKPNHRDQFVMSAEAFVFMIDLSKYYWEPYIAKLKKAEETRLGIAAWEREVRRLRQIQQVFQMVDRKLQHLATAAFPRDAESNSSGMKSEKQGSDLFKQGLSMFTVLKPGGDCKQRQLWLKGWLWQNIIYDGRLEEIWNGLLASGKEENEMIIVEIIDEIV